MPTSPPVTTTHPIRPHARPAGTRDRTEVPTIPSVPCCWLFDRCRDRRRAFIRDSAAAAAFLHHLSLSGAPSWLRRRKGIRRRRGGGVDGGDGDVYKGDCDTSGTSVISRSASDSVSGIAHFAIWQLSRQVVKSLIHNLTAGV